MAAPSPSARLWSRLANPPLPQTAPLSHLITPAFRSRRLHRCARNRVQLEREHDCRRIRSTQDFKLPGQRRLRPLGGQAGSLDRHVFGHHDSSLRICLADGCLGHSPSPGSSACEMGCHLNVSLQGENYLASETQSSGIAVTAGALEPTLDRTAKAGMIRHLRAQPDTGAAINNGPTGTPDPAAAGDAKFSALLGGGGGKTSLTCDWSVIAVSFSANDSYAAKSTTWAFGADEPYTLLAVSADALGGSATAAFQITTLDPSTGSSVRFAPRLAGQALPASPPLAQGCPCRSDRRPARARPRIGSASGGARHPTDPGGACKRLGYFVCALPNCRQGDLFDSNLFQPRPAARCRRSRDRGWDRHTTGGSAPNGQLFGRLKADLP